MSSTVLPPPVQRFVERNVPHSDERPAVARFRQVGEMQLKPGRWLSFEALQETSLERVAFSWRARFPVARLVPVGVHDWYRNGEGGLEVRVFGLPMQRLSGPDIARGEAMRYLAELPWFPQACALNSELEWRELDAATVEVSTQVAFGHAAIRLHFDGAGDIVAASADARPRAVGKGSVDTPFRGEFFEYQVVDGVRLPTRAEVRWELAEGPYTYFRGRLA